jgi:hypothetical protein
MLRQINYRVFFLIIVSADSLGSAEAVKSASWGARNGKFKLSSTDVENPVLIGLKKKIAIFPDIKLLLMKKANYLY